MGVNGYIGGVGIKLTTIRATHGGKFKFALLMMGDVPIINNADLNFSSCVALKVVNLIPFGILMLRNLNLHC